MARRRSIASLYTPHYDSSGRNVTQVEEDGGSDFLGLGNLIAMPGRAVTGLLNLGGLALKGHPDEAVEMFGRGLATGTANLGDTLTGGLLDKQWQRVNDRYGVEGVDVAPLWSREGGILPAIVEDVGTAAAFAAPAHAAAAGGAARSAEAAAAATAAGDTSLAGRLLAASTAQAENAARLEKFAHPYRTLWRSSVKAPAAAAVETKLAASGVTGAEAVQEATAAPARQAVRDFQNEVMPRPEPKSPYARRDARGEIVYDTAAAGAEAPGYTNVGGEWFKTEEAGAAIPEEHHRYGYRVDENGRHRFVDIPDRLTPEEAAAQYGKLNEIVELPGPRVPGVRTYGEGSPGAGLPAEGQALLDQMRPVEGQYGPAPAAGPVEGSIPQEELGQMPEAKPGETIIYHGQNPNTSYGDERWFTRDINYAKAQAGPEGRVYATSVPDDVLAELERAAGPENTGAKLGPARSQAALEAGPISAGRAYEIGGAPQAALEETLGAQEAAKAAKAGARESAVSYGRAAPDDVMAARENVPAQLGREAATEAAREAEKMGKFAQMAAAADNVKRGRVGKFLFGTATKGEEQLSLGTRLMAGVGERIMASELRAELNTQRRFAEAGRRIALHSEPVQTAITVAKEHILPIVGDEHAASRIVGDEIASRMNGIRALQDQFGISDATAVERGWRQEVLPPELQESAELKAAFEEDVNHATQLWREERARATSTMMSTRLGSQGLEGIDSNTPTLTKRELKMFNDARKDLLKAEKLESQIERERIRATKQVAGIDDALGKEAGRLEALKERHGGIIAEFDASRSGLPKMWRDANGATWNDWTLKLFHALTNPDAEFHGFTFDPHAGAEITAPVAKGRYVVGILPGVEGIPLAELTPESIDQVARYYQTLFDGNADVLLGGWLDEDTNMVYIEPSQIVQTRSEAMILGQSRAQIAAWDLTGNEVDTEFGRPDIAGQFAGSRQVGSRTVSNHVFRDRYASQLYAAAEGTKLKPADVDHALTLNDTIASRWGEVTGQHPDLYYSKLRAAGRKAQPRTLVGRLAQTLLTHENPTAELWNEAERAGVDIERARKWYFKSHDAIESRWRGKTVTLLNGHQIDAADLIYQLLAVTSVSAAPLDNLASALTGLANIREFQAEFGAHQGAIERMVKDFMDTSPERPGGGRAPSLRASSDLFQHIGEGTHQMYTVPKYAAFDILSGHTITPYEGWGGWTTDYLRTQPEMFGGSTRALSEAAATPEAVNAMADTLRPAWKGDEASLQAHARDLVIREHQGSKALAKLLSFHDNLANPETSMAVTLDSWMERLFGTHKLWGTAGAYSTYADAMRGIADEMSKRLGEKVMPHEVQAVFWAYAKQEISRQNVGILHGFAAETLDAIENGTWTPATDPFNGYYDLEAGPLREAEARKGVGRDRRWNRSQLKTQVKREHPDWTPYKVGKEVDRLENENPEYAATKAEEAKIKKEGGANRTIERTVPVIRAEEGQALDVRKVRAFAPETETQRYVSSIEKAEKVQEALLKQEQYRNGLQQEMYDLIRNGDTQGASDLFASHVNKLASGIRDERWGDFAEQMANPTGERLPAALDRLAALGDETGVQRLAANLVDEITGATVMPKDPAGKLLVELYRNADFTTLVHEHAHVLRQMLPEEDLRTLEQAYGIKHSKGGWTWTREAEERFANDFTGYLASGRATAKIPGLQGVFTRLRQGLLQVWGRVADSFQRNRLGAAIPEGTRQLIDKYLNPDVVELSDLPGFKMKEAPPTPRMLAKEAQTAPTIPGATGPGMYRAGVGSGRAIERLRENERAQAESVKRSIAMAKARDAIKQSIVEGTLPAQVKQAALRGRATKTLDRLLTSADNPSLSRVPAAWQPMWQAAKDITEMAKKDPTMAEAIGSDLPDTFTKLLAKADEMGVDPAHVRSFTPEQVHRLVFQSMRLGKPGARLGEEAAAGTRFARRYTGARANSIEALAASTIETVWEARTNAVVDMVESRLARTIEAGERIPDGWVAWAPRKASLLTDTAVDTGEQTSRAGGYIIPKAVDTVLRNYSKDFNQPVFRALNRVTNPWRAFVLTLSPRWYVNNLFGNIMLATVEGVRLQDWRRAWEAYRAQNVGGQQIHFSEIPFISGASFVSDIAGSDTIIGRQGLEGLRNAQATGGLKESAKVMQHHLIRANEAVDELARAAVYFKTVRKGGSHAAALERAFTALVDYHALSPFEQQMVRSVVPFYAWQKGMLKLAARMPFDHPAVVPIMYSLGLVNEQIQNDEFGTTLPKGYEGLVSVPGGVISTRGMNPLADASALATPEGITQALNPLIGIGLRKGLHAPQYGEDQIGISDFGTLQNDVNLNAAFRNIGTGLPQVRVLGGSNAKSYGVGSDVSKFLGLPVVPGEQVKGIVKRTKKTRKELSVPGAHGWLSVAGTAKKKKRSGVPSYRQVLASYAPKK